MAEKEGLDYAFQLVDENRKAILEKIFKAKESDFTPRAMRGYSTTLYGERKASNSFLRKTDLDIFKLFAEKDYVTTSLKRYSADFYRATGSAKSLEAFKLFVKETASAYDLRDRRMTEIFVLEVAPLWFSKRVLWTVWQGKAKEALFGRELEKVLPAGCKLYKLNSEQDRKYMMDFWVVYDGQVILGISVKGESYQNGLKSGQHWVNYKEEAENRGHERFRKEKNAAFITAISSNDNPALVKENVDAALKATLKAIKSL